MASKNSLTSWTIGATSTGSCNNTSGGYNGYYTIPTTTYYCPPNITGSYAISGISQSQQPWTFNYPNPTLPLEQLRPFNVESMSEQEIKAIVDFKTRNPDFDNYLPEMGTILETFPAMATNIIYLAMLYDLSKKIRTMIKEYVYIEKNKKEETSSEL